MSVTALAGRTVRRTLRDPVALVFSLFFPLILMALMSAGFAEIVMPGRGVAGYLDHSLPLFAVMGVAFSSLGTAQATYADLGTGFDTRLRTMPVARSAPLVGRVLGDGVRALLTVVVVVVAGLALGFRFRTDALGIVGFLVLPVLLGVGLSWAMIALAVRTRSAEAAGSLSNALLLVLSFLSTGFVPSTDLPDWARPAAAVNPLSLTMDGARALAQGAPAAGAVLGTLAWVVAMVAVAVPLAVRGRERRGR